jgi:hypothetical protein
VTVKQLLEAQSTESDFTIDGVDLSQVGDPYEGDPYEANLPDSHTSTDLPRRSY